jgi:hypothetical protein
LQSNDNPETEQPDENFAAKRLKKRKKVYDFWANNLATFAHLRG